MMKTSSFTHGVGTGLFLLLLGASPGPGAAIDGSDQAGWPGFRGPLGNGTVPLAPGAGPRLPLRWSETENVSWKTALPHRGWSTPAVLDSRVWLTTATEDGRDFFVIGLDVETGAVLLQRRLFHCADPEPLGNSVNCYASPSPALEPGRLYVHFGSYGTACLDTETGQTLWARRDLPCRHFRGPGSSMILFENLLILTFDGVDVQYVAALDKRTGETVWKTDRTTAWTDLDEQGLPKREGDFRKAYSTPLAIRAAGKDQLISPASSALFSYDPRTGRECWKLQHPGYSTSITPVYAGGLIITTTGRGTPELLGVRPDGPGDVSANRVAWRLAGREVPLTPSPVAVGNLVFIVSDQGFVTCLEAATGQKHWSERIGGSHIASPIAEGDRLYFTSLGGTTTILRAGRRFEKLAENALDDGCMASPAAANGALYLRTRTHCYRIEDPGRR